MDVLKLYREVLLVEVLDDEIALATFDDHVVFVGVGISYGTRLLFGD